MPNQPSNDILNPRVLIVPNYTTTERDLLPAAVGTIIFDSTQNKLCFKNDAAAASDSWELITSVEEAA